MRALAEAGKASRTGLGQQTGRGWAFGLPGGSGSGPDRTKLRQGKNTSTSRGVPERREETVPEAPCSLPPRFREPETAPEEIPNPVVNAP